jgi:hypothetical protein
MCLESIPLHQSTLYECRFLTCWSNVCCLLAVAPVRDKSATRKMSRPNREVTSQLSETSNVAAKHLRLVCEALSHQSSLSLCKLHASPQNGGLVSFPTLITKPQLNPSPSVNSVPPRKMSRPNREVGCQRQAMSRPNTCDLTQSKRTSTLFRNATCSRD